MYVFWMVMVGLFVGLGAGLLLHARSYAITVTLGIVGSCAAALLGRSLGWIQGLTGGGIVFSVCGAVLALVVYGIVARRLAGGQSNRVLPAGPQVIGRDRLFATCAAPRGDRPNPPRT